LRLWALICYLGRLSLYIWKQLVKDKCLTSASALAFATLAATIPVATIAFSLYRAFGGLAGFEGDIKKAVFQWLLTVPNVTQQQPLNPNPPPKPAPKETKAGPGKKTGPTAESEDEEDMTKQPSLDAVAENYAATVARWVTRLSDRLYGYPVNAISILALVVIAVFFLNTIEGAFNDIWHTTLKRRLLYKFSVFFVVVMLGPVLIGAAFYLTWRIDQYLKAMPGVDVASRLLLSFLPFLISVAVFFLMYYFLPNAKVRWTSALAGAVVAAILWHLAKRGMYLYVVRVVPYATIYGSIGLALIFMLWLFLTWVLVLLGVEVSYTSQNLHALRYLDQRQKVHFAPLSEALALRVVLLAARSLQHGAGPLTVLAIARQLGVAEEEVRPIADRLAVTRLFTAVTPPGGPFGHDMEYVLAKAPETLTVREAIKAVKEDQEWVLNACSTDEQEQLAALLRQMDESSEQALKGLTLADLIKRMQTE
jgi:membrane protein